MSVPADTRTPSDEQREGASTAPSRTAPRTDAAAVERPSACEPPRGGAHPARGDQTGARAQNDASADSIANPGTSEGALCRSALWEALALGFRPPSAETASRLLAPEGAAALGDAAAWLDRERGTALAPLARRLAGPPDLEAMTAAYQRLFGHTARGLVPPYETEYGADSLFQPIHEMSDLAAFYRAFGLTLRGDARERPDHVACECEFLAFLARKEAYAEERGHAPILEGTRQAIRRFLASHLGRWAHAFGRALTEHDPGGFFGDLGLLATAYVTAECDRVGVPAGPEFLRLRTTADPDIPAACGVPTAHAEGP